MFKQYGKEFASIAELRRYEASMVSIETCDQGHRFAFLPDHPRKDGLKRCPHCMAIGLDAHRA